MTIVGEQVAVLRTGRGVQVGQFPTSGYRRLVWGRELREVSRCELTFAAGLDVPALAEVTPWSHWLDVWDVDADLLVWSGPVLKVSRNRVRGDVVVVARDCAELARRFRCPITRRWESVDVTAPARVLWELLADEHGLPAPAVRLDPFTGRIDFDATADADTLTAAFDRLVRLGLRWSVVAGTPVLGPGPRRPVTALGECDFPDGVTVVRDGSQMCNDVLVRVADEAVRARVSSSGPTLQQIVTVDTLAGVSNADAAAREYLRARSRVRDAVVLDGSARLDPRAPIGLPELVPSTRVTVESDGLLALMEVHSVEVTCQAGVTDVAVGLESVDDDPPELATAIGQSGGGAG